MKRKTNSKTKAKATPKAARQTAAQRRSAAAKRAWVTIRANRAAKAKKLAPAAGVAIKASAPSVYTSGFLALAKTPTAKPQKLVKGLIKDTPATNWENSGQFGVSNINARGLTKAQIQGTTVTAPPPAPKSEPIRANTLQELFTQQDRWIKSATAKNKQGVVVSAYDDSASCFCLTGGLAKVYGGKTAYYEVEQKLSKIVDAYNGRPTSLVTFNDSVNTSFVDLQRVLRLAGV